MNDRLSAWLVMLTLLAAAPFGMPTLAQGFAGLGTDAEGFAMPQRGRVFEFPRDHGPHPDYRIEWWYLTANLTGEDGEDYGVQWTLFRSALAPGERDSWSSPQIWMGHAGLTQRDRHFSAERFGRGGTGQAGVSADPFHAWIDEWQMRNPAGAGDLDTLDVTATGPEFGYTLSLQAEGPLVKHGDDGYSVKSERGQASYYYSQPHYRAEGTLKLPEGEVAVTGRAWLDREWSSQPLDADQEGWDWFSLHFDSGARMMGFGLRGPIPFTYATWITPEGTAQPMPHGALRLTPTRTEDVAGRDTPVAWRLELPQRDLDITVEALNPQSWMDLSVSYWEGPVHVSGSHSGRGYLEMTGYD